VGAIFAAISQSVDDLFLSSAIYSHKADKMSLIRLLQQGVTKFSLSFRHRKRSRLALERAIRAQAEPQGQLRKVNGRLYINRMTNNRN
jgi:hypothetical protein